MSISTYYLVSIPLACVFSFYFDLSLRGLWLGLYSGVTLQLFILVAIMSWISWQSYAEKARDRMQKEKENNKNDVDLDAQKVSLTTLV